jgi:hypothetical protein
VEALPSIWERHSSRLYEYSRREPQKSALYQILYNYREEFEQRYEELFEERYGFLRGNVLESFDAYLNCGILRHGCARAVCEECNHSELIAFSCKERVVCPSCSAKRSHIFAETLHENILLPHPHKHVVFTIPKRLRPYFKYDRSLLKLLYKAGWKAWRDYAEGVHAEGTPAGIMSLHTAGDLINFHPHLHALLLPGVIDSYGNYLEIAEIDQELLCEYFSEEVFEMFLERELLSEEDVLLMKSWKHSGFSVWFGEDILPEAKEQRLFTGRYLVKCPLSLDRLSVTNDESVMYVGKERDDGSDPDSKMFSPLEFLAELSQHIPNTYEQLIRYYGYYSARSRGARRREAELQKSQNQPDHEAMLPDTDSDKKPVSKSWARLIKKVFEVDPLKCPKCGSRMHIKAFIQDSKEIARICQNLGIADWRAPPEMGKDKKYQEPEYDEYLF